MSGHGLEDGSREEKVTVLDEDGEVSKSERLRLKAMDVRNGGCRIEQLL